MDFDFTDDDGNGVEIDTYGTGKINVTIMLGNDYAAAFLTPTEARAIAEALNTAANHIEEN